jgi:hypothetical protein
MTAFSKGRPDVAVVYSEAEADTEDDRASAEAWVRS